MQIENNKSLKTLNTFGFDHKAQYYTEVNSAEDLEAATAYARDKGLAVFILGGGSNLVLTQDIPGLTVRLTCDSTSYYTDNSKEETKVVVQAGKNWHQLVRESTEQSLSGIENLSLIPGTAGAAPVQNIGAYGVELEQCFTSLRALHLNSGEWVEFSHSDCEFAYRTSHFKTNANQYAIYSVTLSLSRLHSFNTGYHALAAELEHIGKPLSSRVISDAVCAIRRRKLPDPQLIGNAGSFFKNPVIDAKHYQQLLEQNPDIVAFQLNTHQYKVAAGWLIDSLDFKGMKQDGVGVYDKQALVLVNPGTGTASALMKLADKIRNSVLDHYRIELEIEPLVM